MELKLFNMVSHADWMSIRSSVTDPYLKYMHVGLFFRTNSGISRIKRKSYDCHSLYSKRH